jgi:hypothetical protein
MRWQCWYLNNFAGSETNFLYNLRKITVNFKSEICQQYKIHHWSLIFFPQWLSYEEIYWFTSTVVVSKQNVSFSPTYAGMSNSWSRSTPRKVNFLKVLFFFCVSSCWKFKSIQPSALYYYKDVTWTVQQNFYIRSGKNPSF